MSEEKVKRGRKVIERDTIMVVGLFASIFLFSGLFYCIGSIIPLGIAFCSTIMMWGISCLIWVGYWCGEGDLSISKKEMER